MIAKLFAVEGKRKERVKDDTLVSALSVRQQTECQEVNTQRKTFLKDRF